MSMFISRANHPISKDDRCTIAKRYKTITRAVNGDFWDSDSETAHSRYVGSYGRGTAIDTSDLDVLVELPAAEYDRFASANGNGPSRLLQAVRSAILDTYPRTDVHGDGQVVVVSFSDGMRFEVLPAFKDSGSWLAAWDGAFKYPDTHMGGRWLSTYPLAEQEAMKERNGEFATNGLLFDTCKHIRFVRDEYFSSYHLSGILIDSFAYVAADGWHWTRQNEPRSGLPKGSYEASLVEFYDKMTDALLYGSQLTAPGSGMVVDTGDDWDVLGKVLGKMA